MDSYIILTENKNMMKIKIEYINITIDLVFRRNKSIWVEKTLSVYLCKEIIARKSNLWRNTNEMVK